MGIDREVLKCLKIALLASLARTIRDLSEFVFGACKGDLEPFDPCRSAFDDARDEVVVNIDDPVVLSRVAPVETGDSGHAVKFF